MKQKSTFSVTFYCRESKVNKKSNLAPIEMSVTINGKRTFINLPQKIEPSKFSKAMDSKRGNEIKSFCNTYYNMVNCAIRDLIADGKVVTIDDVKSIITGNNTAVVYTFNQMWIDFMTSLRQKVDVNIELSTYCKYQKAQEYSLKAIGKDKPIDEIMLADIENMYAFMRKTCSQNTANKYATMVKSAYRFAVNNGKTTHYPFTNFKMKTEVKEIAVFSEDEYERIKNATLTYPHLDNARNIFIFLCNTGLSYGDLAQLQASDVQDVNGVKLICKPRLKTNVMYYSVVLNDGIEMLTKVKMISNQKLNSYLKIIEQSLGISVHLHCHLARHYYASHLLQSGIPIEIVSKCLGHSKITMTQHYAKLLKENVANSVAQAFIK